MGEMIWPKEIVMVLTKLYILSTNHFGDKLTAAVFPVGSELLWGKLLEYQDRAPQFTYYLINCVDFVHTALTQSSPDCSYTLLTNLLPILIN